MTAVAPSTSMGLDSRKLGMWTFLASEFLFFGAFVSAYLLYLDETNGGFFWSVDSAGTAPVVDDFLLFQTSAGPVVRQVASVAGQIATFDRAYAGTPTTASTVSFEASPSSASSTA